MPEAGRCLGCLCPELVPCVLIDSCAPELGGFAAAYVPDVDEILIECFGASFTGLMHEHDHVIVRGGEVVDFQPERAAGEFHELCEEAHHSLVTLVVTSDRRPPTDMPFDVVGEWLQDRRDVASLEGLIAALQQLLI